MRTRREAGAGLSILAGTLFLLSCSSIPPESVTLSRKIGEGIEQGRQAQIGLLDEFFLDRKADLDRWVIDVYLPEFSKRFREKINAACRAQGLTGAALEECTRPGDDQIRSTVRSVIRDRDGMQSALEKSHMEVARVIETHYADLARANAGLTALLQSAVDVSKATAEATGAATAATGGKVDFDELRSAFDGALKVAGEGGKGVQDFQKSLDEAVKKIQALTGKPPGTP